MKCKASDCLNCIASEDYCAEHLRRRGIPEIDIKKLRKIHDKWVRREKKCVSSEN